MESRRANFTPTRPLAPAPPRRLDSALAGVLPPTKPSGAISSRMRCPGIALSSFSSRWISSLNGSSFDPAGTC